ncbi:MAG: DUF2240 family protein [Candidatus Aenigmarchaeota archaeon]|nr:DUF2240 family protein [Candidatus Aenigmarchaeota archaeon]
MISEMITKIAADSGLNESEIKARVQEKQEELSGLISEEGAVYIVAKELGVQLLKKKERLYIGSIVPGMKNVDVVGKITKIFPVKEFKTDKAEGKVVNIIIADHTGSVRLSLWNEELQVLEQTKIGDVIHFKGFSREGYDGYAELRIGKYGLLQRSSEKIDVAEEPTAQIERSSIKDLQEGYRREVRACLMQLFNSNMFYPVCPQCRASLKEANGFKCEEHGEVSPEHNIVLTGIIDDGTESIRVVLFNEQAEFVLGMTKNEAKRIFDMKRDLKHVYEKAELGREYVFSGKVRRNTFFDRLEFVTNSVKSVDIKEEINRLLPRGTA